MAGCLSYMSHQQGKNMNMTSIRPYLDASKPGLSNTGIVEGSREDGFETDKMECSSLSGRMPENPVRVSLAGLPSNLILPGKKRMGLPMPNLRLLMGAATLGLLATFGGSLSAAAAEGDSVGKLTPSQIEDIRKTLKPGDIILSRTPSNQLYYILQKAAFGSTYSHAAMYAGDNRIVDAYGKVKSQGVEEFCSGQTAMTILRPSYGSDVERGKALDYLESQIGKPYDWRFDLSDDGGHYCTEIILRALEASNPGFSVTGRWILGKPVVVPDDFLNARNVKVVKEYN